MQTVKINTVINSDSLRLANLGFLKGKMVEVTIKPIEKNSDLPGKNHLLRGYLKNYAEKKLKVKEKDAWTSSVKDKYDN
ncbi:MAG: hypothetical protein EPN82_16380 [Bacteroidetes bacterium]|nr:MAG: hypothetical protein EPN82_16380 [Bacteroidota bacterium]